MAKKEVYVIDNILVYAGTMLLALSLLFLYTIAQELVEGIVNEMLIERLAVALVTFIIGLVFSYTGRVIRQKEKDVILVWDALEHSGEVSIQKLQKKTGFTREFLHEAVLLINKQSIDLFIWDEDTGLIENSLLNNRPLSTARPPKKGFSFIVFVLLSIAALPAGILYAVLKRKKYSPYLG